MPTSPESVLQKGPGIEKTSAKVNVLFYLGYKWGVTVLL